MLTTFWLLLGLILGSLYLFFVRSTSSISEKRAFAVGLVIAAIIYIGFALTWGTFNWVLIEILGVFFYTWLAWLGITRSYLLLALGWLIHPAWDVFLHLIGPGQAVAPQWYAIACISFDVLVGVYIIYRGRAWTESLPQPEIEELEL